MDQSLVETLAKILIVSARKRGRRLSYDKQLPAGRLDQVDRLSRYLWHAFGEWAEDYEFVLKHAEVLVPILDRLLQED